MAEIEASKAKEHPSMVIASQSKLYSEKDRLLYARIEDNAGGLGFYLHPSPALLLDEIVSGLVWNDPAAKNLPYSTLCIHPMTEPNRPCVLSLDIEEEFLNAFKDEQDPPLEQVPAEDREDEARMRRLGKVGKYSGAREANLEALHKRERDFAMRCRWVPILIRCSIMALYDYDISDTAVYAYSGCTNAKNSFHMHFWLVVCQSTAQWRDILLNAYKILNGLPDAHACKMALLRTELCQRNEKEKKYIIDFGIANDHRQLRAAFQRKAPGKDNAFVPYSIAAGARVPLSMGDRDKLRDWIKPTVLGMAIQGMKHDQPFVFGHQEFVMMRDELWKHLEEELQKDINTKHDPTKNVVPQSINALRVLFDKHVKPSTVGGSAAFNEVKAKLRSLYEYLKNAVGMVNGRIVFPDCQKSSSDAIRLKRCCYRAFVCLLVSAAITCVLSPHRDFGNTTHLIKTVFDDPDEIFEERLMPKPRKDRSETQRLGDARMIRYIINSVVGPYLACVVALEDRVMPIEGFDLRQSLCRNQIVVLGMQRILPDPDSARVRRNIVSDWDLPVAGVRAAQRYWFPNEQDRAVMKIINDKPEPTRREKAMGLVTSQLKSVTEMAADVERRNKPSVLKRAVTSSSALPLAGGAEDGAPKKVARLAKVKVRRGDSIAEAVPTERFWNSAFGLGNHCIEAPLDATT